MKEPHEIQSWLEKLAARKNTLAMSYLAILQEAAPETKKYWLSMLGNVLDDAAVGEEDEQQSPAEE